MNEKNLKITVGIIVFFFFSIASLILLFMLNLHLIDVFKLSFYEELLTTNLLPLLLLLFFMGVSISSLVLTVKQLPLEKSLVTAGVCMLVLALIIILVFGSNRLTLTVAVFSILGVLFMTVLPGTPPSGYWSAFSQGWRAMSKVFFFLALGALFGSLFMISAQPDEYQDSFKEVIKSFAQEQSNMQLSREQIRELLEAQIDSSDLSMTREEVRTMLESSYIEPSVEDYIALTYPDFATYPPETQQAIRIQVTELLASNDYHKQVEETLDKQAEAYYLQLNDPLSQEKQRQKLKQNLDAQVEVQYQRFQELNNNNVFAQQADVLFESLPLFQRLLDALPFLVAFTLFSIILLVGNVASFAGGVTFMAYFLWQSPSSGAQAKDNGTKGKEQKTQEDNNEQ
ncbi:hypothetical protein HYW21_05425 [Candidatus Woesearchaeota archaeon]|nr:hypothetical protein [Candidatus Woesearchaeota archaeon]